MTTFRVAKDVLACPPSSARVLALSGRDGLISLVRKRHAIGRGKKANKYVLSHFHLRSDVKSNVAITQKKICKRSAEILMAMERFEPGTAYSWASKLCSGGADAGDEMLSWLMDRGWAKARFASVRSPEELDAVIASFVRVATTS